jgi:hypothetical protein
MITNVFVSGVQQNTGGNINLSTAAQIPNTEAYSITFQGALTGSAPTGSSYQTAITQHIFTADAPCQIVGVIERHSVVGSGDAIGWRFAIPGAFAPVGGVTVTLAYI